MGFTFATHPSYLDWVKKHYCDAARECQLVLWDGLHIGFVYYDSRKQGWGWFFGDWTISGFIRQSDCVQSLKASYVECRRTNFEQLRQRANRVNGSVATVVSDALLRQEDDGMAIRYGEWLRHQSSVPDEDLSAILEVLDAHGDDVDCGIARSVLLDFPGGV
ncbi:MAG: hypothetical protein J7642_21195 [Cyanobacteria bacterium SBC]|nr:hypothetical protein [Cyanobacteria bacterium SBC]